MGSKEIKKGLRNFNKRLVSLQIWLKLLDRIFQLGAYLCLSGFTAYGLKKAGLELVPSLAIILGLTYIIFRHGN